MKGAVGRPRCNLLKTKVRSKEERIEGYEPNFPSVGATQCRKEDQHKEPRRVVTRDLEVY